MRALVTGAAGFIASHVVDRLLVDGWSVTGIDNFDPYYDPAQKRRNVARALQSDRYRLIEGDVCEVSALGEAFDAAAPEVVVHLAARAGVRASIADPGLYVRVNEQGGLAVLDACRRAGNVPLVYASTSSVYGDSARAPFREDDPAVTPLSPYAASKRAGELMAGVYNRLYGLPVAVLRFFTVYGPRGRPDMAIASFTRALRSGQAIRLHGEETQRDFTYVDDIVSGVVGAISWVRSERAFDVFNLGRSQPVRVRRLIELLAAKLGIVPEITLAELEPGESRVTAADVSKAAAAFGYAPQVSLDEGLERWVRWLASDEAGSTV